MSAFCSMIVVLIIARIYAFSGVACSNTDYVSRFKALLPYGQPTSYVARQQGYPYTLSFFTYITIAPFVHSYSST
jgi:hypothetical protein